MTLDAPRLTAADLRDRHEAAPVLRSEVALEGRVWDVRRDTLRLVGSGVDTEVVREYVAHTGAVGVVALRTDRELPEIFVIQQYRHPVRAHDWEIPAGLLDVPGEDPLVAARRELAEEADLVAGTWEELVSFTPSPGGLDEVITVYLATDLADVPEADRHEREHEEAGMPCGWVSLEDAVAAVLGGQVRNGALIIAVLALDRLRP
ncbi:NUDIX domain-containing protein [Ornithinimicrobium tianjinense]|uniref:NUDIX hydrolase n=1 Tax=Ornithinimicrobium tianjinense TaxID=1195761 RepID=A0A917BK19_9MICO|nr:NUDIX hydrolase [Ornithinimicrobium tianjinense]GGF48604.1 NUDIX hydrolase [Ornithinimicrobium tianjinense]